MEGEGLIPFSFVRISGAVAEAGSLPVGSPSAGNENERGDGLAGENGPEIERARAWELPGKDKDWRIAGGWCLRGGREEPLIMLTGRGAPKVVRW